MQSNIVIKLQKAIETLRASHIPHSKSVFYADSIDSKMRTAIARWYAPIPSDENILLFTNKIQENFLGFFRTGICITDKAVYCRLQADTYLSTLTFNRSKKIIPLTEIKSMSIGKTDHCLGTNYEGHQLLINNKVVGLIRMGGGMGADDDMISELTQIFKTFDNE